MCGRFTLLLSWSEIHDLLQGFVSHLQADAPPELAGAPPRYNIAPTQPILVLLREAGKTRPRLMRWGLVPEWVADPATFPLIINARGETLTEKASFRNAVKNRRCIVPCSGYYEWQRHPDATKTPTYIFRCDKRPFLMAGLWSTWVGPEGEEVDTAAIVTTSANAELEPVHHRMPAMLEGEQVEQWLDTGNVNAQRARQLIAPAATGVACHYPVSARVNSPANDDETLIRPASEKTRLPDGADSADKDAERDGNQSRAPRQLDLF